MDKEWFESMFTNDDQTDQWGHQYRATQKIRLDQSYNILIKNIQPNHNSVGDLCCGLGDFIARIKNKKLFGFDISYNAISRARKIYKNIDFSQNELPSIPHSLDIIITLECLNYLDIETTIDKIYNSLNNKGLFLVSIEANKSTEVLKFINKDFKLIKIKYLYFGLFSIIEPKLLFYTKDLDYILSRKKARNKFLLQKLIDSNFSLFIKFLMKTLKCISFFILKSKILVLLSTLARKKSHIIILGEKI